MGRIRVFKQRKTYIIQWCFAFKLCLEGSVLKKTLSSCLSFLSFRIWYFNNKSRLFLHHKHQILNPLRPLLANPSCVTISSDNCPLLSQNIFIYFPMKTTKFLSNFIRYRIQIAHAGMYITIRHVSIFFFFFYKRIKNNNCTILKLIENHHYCLFNDSNHYMWCLELTSLKVNCFA